MNMMVVYSLVTLGGVGFLLGASLAFASKKFAVEVDPKVEQVEEILPGANCGGCGYAGCASYAKAVVLEGADSTLCAPGGPSVQQKIAEILGTEVEDSERLVAFLHCAGSNEKAKNKYNHDGIKDCRIATQLAFGPKDCAYGCIGYGNCERVCPFDAIHMSDNGLPVVDMEKCTACGNCVRECPKDLFELLPDTTKIYLACSSHDKGKTVKNACTVGCIGCSICAKVTEGDAIVMKDNLPEVHYDQSPNLILAHYKCPTNSYIDLVAKRPHMNISTKCVGHHKCAEVCPVKNCISGEPGEPHIIDPRKCIGCGLCLDVCPEKAINVVGAMGYVGLDENS